MPVYKRVAGAWVSTTPKRNISGTMTTATSVKRRSGGVWIECLGGTVSITNQTVYSGVISPADATVLYEVNPNGKIYNAINNAPATIYETWLTSGVNTEFQCRATLVSGTLTTSSGVGTWVTMSGGQAWTVARTVNSAGINSAVLTIEIRRVSDSVVIDTATITLNAEVTL